MTATKMIVGNWKMNGLSASLFEAKAIAAGLEDLASLNSSVVICPPATLIGAMTSTVAGSKLLVGGQDCHGKVSGAHTGDISAQMLADSGARFVIVGHSERRADHGETSAAVQVKAEAAIAAGLLPIICVGETQAQRDGGAAEAVVLEQVTHSIPATCDASQVCIAYEPVWAIGTGRVPSEDDVAAMHKAIRTMLVTRFGEAGGSVPILYGGSVNAGNAAVLLAVANVDGALVGGASLKADSFLSIVSAQV